MSGLSFVAHDVNGDLRNQVTDRFFLETGGPSMLLLYDAVYVWASQAGLAATVGGAARVFNTSVDSIVAAVRACAEHHSWFFLDEDEATPPEQWTFGYDGY